MCYDVSRRNNDMNQKRTSMITIVGITFAIVAVCVTMYVVITKYYERQVDKKVESDKQNLVEETIHNEPL